MVRTISRYSHKQVNSREVVWHWNAARAPSIFKTKSSFLWLIIIIIYFLAHQHKAAGVKTKQGVYNGNHRWSFKWQMCWGRKLHSAVEGQWTGTGRDILSPLGLQWLIELRFYVPLDTNLNLTNMQKCKNCSCVCAHHCAQWSYTTQHRAVLTIFRLILQTSTRAQIMSTGGEGRLDKRCICDFIWAG